MKRRLGELRSILSHKRIKASFISRTFSSSTIWDQTSSFINVVKTQSADFDVVTLYDLIKRICESFSCSTILHTNALRFPPLQIMPIRAYLSPRGCVSSTSLPTVRFSHTPFGEKFALRGEPSELTSISEIDTVNSFGAFGVY